MNSWRQVWQWFLSLETRERRVLGAGVIILVVFVLYTGLVSPYVHHRATLNSELQSERSLIAWMRPAVARIESLRGLQRSALPGGSLLSAVNSSAASAGLGTALQQAQTTNDGAVHVQFTGVNFDSLVQWLVTLQRTYGVTASDSTVTRGPGPGLVDASLALRAPTQ